MSAPSLTADSGPLIALARLDLLGLPALLYAEVLVPAEVWDEVLRQPPDDERAHLQAAAEAAHVKVVQERPTAAPLPSDPRLGAGERAAIDLARLHGTAILIDERRGRRAAAGAGLMVIGTIGLLVRGRQLGLVGPVRPLFERLRLSGYHLADELTARALAVLDE